MSGAPEKYEGGGALAPTGPVGGNPFGKGVDNRLAAGTVAIESERAIAEAQGKLVIAKRFQRDVNAAHAELMTACKIKSLAEAAFYSYPRGGESITGPSIRLAEEIARCWGNIDYGLRELSQKPGESEMEAFAWDMQTNTVSRQTFTVKHERHTRSGVKQLTDPRDIYELCANMGGRRLRARIMAVIPKWLQEEAVAACRQTLAGDSSVSIEERVRKMTVAFGKYGVTVRHIEKRIRKPLSEIHADDLADLIGTFQSIKDGVTKVSDWFDNDAQDSKVADAVERQMKSANEESSAPAVHQNAADKKTAPPAVESNPKEAKPRNGSAKAGAETKAAQQSRTEPAGDAGPDFSDTQQPAGGSLEDADLF